jgi:hypothetical protein
VRGRYELGAIASGALVTVTVVALITHDDDRLGPRYAVANGDDEAITSEPPEEQDVTPQASARW